MDMCTTFAVSGFFKDTGFEKPETRYTSGTNPQDAVGNLVATAGDFKLLAVVSKDDLLATLKQLEDWESTQNARN